MILICPHCKHKHVIQSEDLDFLNQREFITCNNCFCNFLINPNKNKKQQTNIKIVSKKREYKNIEDMGLFETFRFLFTLKRNQYSYYKANFFDNWARNCIIFDLCIAFPLFILYLAIHPNPTPIFFFTYIVTSIIITFFLRVYAYHLERDKNGK